MARDWHRAIYEQVISVPIPYFVGGIRDSDPNEPELVGYEVAVGGAAGVLSARVLEALRQFEAALQAVVATLDTEPDARTEPRVTLGVLHLAAFAHGEWIRIHPFANGNGRIARVWVAWICARYHLPPLVVVKPRPHNLEYALAAAESMAGRHQRMALYLTHQLRLALRARP